jgi:hypothetical protein
MLSRNLYFILKFFDKHINSYREHLHKEVRMDIRSEMSVPLYFDCETCIKIMNDSYLMQRELFFYLFLYE